jgi:hypothetical protein
VEADTLPEGRAVQTDRQTDWQRLTPVALPTPRPKAKKPKAEPLPADVAAAVAAVEEAALKLPPESGIKFTEMADTVGGFNQKSEDAPPLRGQKARLGFEECRQTERLPNRDTMSCSACQIGPVVSHWCQ